MEEIIWTEKHRPNDINDIILLPRIKEIFEDNIIKGNYIFKGPPGMGKTTLSKILMKNCNYKYFDSKSRLGINDIQQKIEDFCNSYNPLDKKIKLIFFDEFMVSNDFQEAIRGYIEESSKRGVRWIITTNYPEKIINAVRSRFREIDFFPQTPEERKFLKINYFKNIKKIILKENKEIKDELLIKIIESSFPDMRKATDMSNSVAINDNNIIVASCEDIFEIFNKELDSPENLWNYCLSFQGKEHETMRNMATPLVNYILKKRKDKIPLIPFIAEQYKEHEIILKTSNDPFIILYSYISSIYKKINIKS